MGREGVIDHGDDDDNDGDDHWSDDDDHGGDDDDDTGDDDDDDAYDECGEKTSEGLCRWTVPDYAGDHHDGVDITGITLVLLQQ